MQPRDYQVAAIEGVSKSIRSGHKRIVLCVPTGGGKSTIYSIIAKRANAKGSKTLFMVHSKELVEQAATRLRTQVHVNCGIIMAGHRQHRDLPNQVASVQTLVRRKLPEADIIFIDEAHRAKAKTYEKILSGYPDAVVIGLTATPFRTDGKGLGDIFTDIVHPIRVRDLIGKGFLVGTKVMVPKECVSTDGLKVRAGDYDKKELAALFEDGALVKGVVENYLRFAQGKKAIVFHASVALSKQINERFLQEGVRSAHADGTTSREERTKIIDAYRRGEIEVFNNCALVREGFDVPSTDVVILNTATKSLGMYVQTVGRGLRPAAGKTECLVIDHGNNVIEHGYAEDYDLAPFTLETTKKKKEREFYLKPKVCPHCRAVNALTQKRCLSCDTPFPTKERQIMMSDSRSFVAVDRDEIVMSIVENLDPKKKKVPPHLLRIVRAFRGYKPGWVGYKAKEIGIIDMDMSHPLFWRKLDKELTLAEHLAGTTALRQKIEAV